MIPTSYLTKTLYTDRWGDPANPHAIDVPAKRPAPQGGEPLFSLVTLASTLRQRLQRRPTVNTCADPACA